MEPGNGKPEVKLDLTQVGGGLGGNAVVPSAYNLDLFSHHH